MVLAQDVRDMNGRKLLAAGTDINQKSLQILQTWGISEVEIENSAAAEAEDSAADSGTPVPEEVQELFSLIDTSHPLIAALREQSVQVRSYREYDSFLHLPEQIPPLNRNSLPRSAAAVAETAEFPALPEVYQHILEVINNPRSSTLDISDAITKDPSFTSRILKLANSSFYAMRNSIDTVSKAVSIIGTRQLGTLALGISISRSLFSSQSHDSSLAEFWRHSVAAAIAARTLAIFLKEKNTERFFIGGLLHDIGKLLLYNQLKETVYHIDALSRSHKLNQFAVEQNLLGFTHADVGREICQRMSLPENLHSMVSDHHNVAESLRGFEASVIHLADIIVNGVKKGSSGEAFVPALQAAAVEHLDLEPSTIDIVVRQVESHGEEIARIMFDEE